MRLVPTSGRRERAGAWAIITKEDAAMDRWECMVCGYVYDPAKGDPANGIAPGTAFEELPADWVCPDCGASKDMFEKVS